MLQSSLHYSEYFQIYLINKKKQRVAIQTFGCLSLMSCSVCYVVLTWGHLREKCVWPPEETFVGVSLPENLCFATQITKFSWGLFHIFLKEELQKERNMWPTMSMIKCRGSQGRIHSLAVVFKFLFKDEIHLNYIEHLIKTESLEMGLSKYFLFI